MTQCREKLYEAAQKSDWYDNVTVTFCKITSGKPYVATAATAINNAASKAQSDDTKQPENLKESGAHSVFVIRKSYVRIIIAIAVLLLIIIGAGLFFMLKSKPVQQPAPAPIEQKPTMVQNEAADEVDFIDVEDVAESTALPAENKNKLMPEKRNVRGGNKTNVANLVKHENDNKETDSQVSDTTIAEKDSTVKPNTVPDGWNLVSPETNNQSLQ